LQQNSIGGNSFSLLIENIENKERAALQIEVVDVNDNSPKFLGGPFPLELVIPVVNLQFIFNSLIILIGFSIWLSSPSTRSF